MNIVTKALSELKHPAKNVRRHTEKQLKEYVRSLDMFGQIKPIIIDENGEIIVGNGLYDALLKMGKDHCECRIIPGLSNAQKKKLMLADNRVYELGITDMDIFEQIIRELDGDIDIPGWETDLLEMMNASVAEVDDMVGSYGIYEQNEVAAMNRRQREGHENLAQKPLQLPQSTNLQAAKVSTPTAETQPVEPVNANYDSEKKVIEQNFVLCPKCGERIWL